MTAYVLTVPGPLSMEDVAQFRDQLSKWDGKTPAIVQAGARLSLVGGLTLTPRLYGGPMEGMSFSITVGSLLDVPEFFEALGGRYERWVGDDGGQVHGTDGSMAYRWVSA